MENSHWYLRVGTVPQCQVVKVSRCFRNASWRGQVPILCHFTVHAVVSPTFLQNAERPLDRASPPPLIDASALSMQKRQNYDQPK
jgi:hypothetical protein